MNSGDLNSIIENYIKQYGTAPDVIESMNEFYSQGIELILSQFFKVEKPVANKRSETINGQNIETLKLVVTFHNVELLRPSDSGKIQYPADARLGGKTYSGRLTTDVHIKLTIFLANGKSIEREDIKHKHHIANIPIMVGSNMCNTWQMTNAALTSVQEDPTDPQGYFIINGSEWFINKLFSRKYNIFHVFHNEFEQDIEFARADIISMPGDSFENSSEMQTRYLKSGELVITLTSDRYFKLIGIPFYIILRLFGIQSEKAIVENIVPNSGFADTDNKMKSILLDMFLVKSKNFPEAREIDNLVDLRAYCIKVIANNYINTQSVIDLNQRQLDLEREIAILMFCRIRANFRSIVFQKHCTSVPELI